MKRLRDDWDYLIVTAANASQAHAYQAQLDARRQLGLIQGVKRVLVVPDREGKRLGSGGSTLRCWMEVLKEKCGRLPLSEINEPDTWLRVLSDLRILIIHAGGDSRRLPAYGACGKLFVPVPGRSDTAVGVTLFDRQLLTYLSLPSPEGGAGHTVITTGDVLLFFDPREVRFQAQGITGLGAWVPPEEARHHGVFCSDERGFVQTFLQKPDPRDMKERGCLNNLEQALLDIGVMSISPEAAVRLLTFSEAKANSPGDWDWSGFAARSILRNGLDFYGEICPALGEKTRLADYLRNVPHPEANRERAFREALYSTLQGLPFFVNRLSACEFMHFGTMGQLIQSGRRLQERQAGGEADSIMCMNSRHETTAEVSGGPAWLDGCLVEAELSLQGDNLVLGADIRSPLSLPSGFCLDILKGSRKAGGDSCWYVRLYRLDDDFKASSASGAVYCGIGLEQWLKALNVKAEEIWDPGIDIEERSVWNARLFPEVFSPSDYGEWLWMLRPLEATSREVEKWRKTNRFSAQEIAELADLNDFYLRRWKFQGMTILENMARFLRSGDGPSASEIAFIWERLDEPQLLRWVSSALQATLGKVVFKGKTGAERLSLSRILHTLASALEQAYRTRPAVWSKVWPALTGILLPATQEIFPELRGEQAGQEQPPSLTAWCRAARAWAFFNLGRTIVLSTSPGGAPPRKSLRADEIVWGRAPARLDLGGGWTDTPPYALEKGGCVINAAVDLNGQPPIQVYARIIPEPEIRISSIDHGTRIAVTGMQDLLDYRQAASDFGLAKAALALSGFSSFGAVWPDAPDDLAGMLDRFGGGIELTTLAAIPSGSGLGTSSIMGAVLISVIARLTGKTLSSRELFHKVLQLEQELTTGGGWQDQIGGSLPGVKMISSEPGLVPDPQVKNVPADALDPAANGGRTLLYYTGMRRLAKNILRNIVGSYLDRDRRTLGTLAKLYAFPSLAVEAMEQNDVEGFGKLIDLAWRLNKELDPESSNQAVEEILKRFDPYMVGAKLLGAGGGGFLLIVCRSPEDAVRACQDLRENPPNPLARFFDFSINQVGLEVTVC